MKQNRNRDRPRNVTGRPVTPPGVSHQVTITAAASQLVSVSVLEEVDRIASRFHRDPSSVTAPGPVTPATSRNLILSLFPGIDLLGMGFEQAGYCVVRGPDPLFGGDIRSFRPLPGIFGGIIAGSPCQDFSRARRAPPTGEGLEMLGHFRRCVLAALPDWYLLENVPGVPTVDVPGYTVQRINVRASEYGAAQHRLRALQFGSRDGVPLILQRLYTRPIATEPAAMATEGTGKKRRGWVDFWALQGLPPLGLEGMTKAAKYRAVGNGVDLRVSRDVATSIRTRGVTSVTPCACGCGRSVKGRQRAAGAACRKRLERGRKCDPAGVGLLSSVTVS